MIAEYDAVTVGKEESCSKSWQDSLVGQNQTDNLTRNIKLTLLETVPALHRLQDSYAAGYLIT
jgi:hypothetical protein